MIEPLTEAEARTVLALARPTASDTTYRATRLAGGGWYFGLDDTEDRVGGVDWIVADNRRATAVHFSEDIGQVLTKLLSEDP